MITKFEKINKINGELYLPGDKSISHRSVMFASMAEGKSIIRNLSFGEDVKSTSRCFKELGVEINHFENHTEVIGKGFKGFTKPKSELDCGNSGTTVRLISGILSPQNFESILIGDESLSKRPMKRVIEPLSLMGVSINSNNGFLPLEINPVECIKPISYELQVASAQVKSALLLCGLHSEETSFIIEAKETRDHTERMLGLPVKLENGKRIIESSKKYYPQAKEYFVPSDISTAAFFMILTLLSKDSELLIKNVSLNPSRTGIITILQKMNGNIEIVNRQSSSGEDYGDLFIKSSNLVNIEIPSEIIPNIIDEIPILAIAGIFAEGKFKISEADELRVKESDRIKSMVYNLQLLGINVKETTDGFEFENNRTDFETKAFESFDDHRIAMAFAVFSLLNKNGGEVNNFDCAKISNPNFMAQLNSIIK
jgi:3-phosphoshikimate 1-carboxyvinyltransferase